MNFDLKMARAICNKYAEIKRTPYVRHLPEHDSDFLEKAEELLPTALDEIERLQAENKNFQRIEKLELGNIFGNDGYVVDLQRNYIVAVEERMSLKKEIKQLQKENAELKTDAEKWQVLITQAGRVGLSEDDLFKMTL